MSGRIDWDKVNRDKRFSHAPTKPKRQRLPKRHRPTQKQLAYLTDLRAKAGITGAPPPRTRIEASDAIDHLKLGIAPITDRLGDIDESVRRRAAT